MLEPFRMELWGWVAVKSDGQFLAQNDGQPLTPKEIEELKTYRAYSRCAGLVPQC
jgi:hypothetical protein